MVRPGFMTYHEDAEMLLALAAIDRNVMAECMVQVINYSLTLEKTGEIISCEIQNPMGQAVINRMTEKILRDAGKYGDRVRTNTINSWKKNLKDANTKLGAKLTDHECYNLAVLRVDNNWSMSAEEIVMRAKELMAIDDRPDTDRIPTDDRTMPNYNHNVAIAVTKLSEAKPETKPTSLQTYPNSVGVPQTDIERLVDKAKQNGILVTEKVRKYLEEVMARNTFEYVWTQLDEPKFISKLK